MSGKSDRVVCYLGMLIWGGSLVARLTLSFSIFILGMGCSCLGCEKGFKRGFIVPTFRMRN